MPPNWGLRPELCRIAGVGIPAYEAFMLLAIAAAALLYACAARQTPELGERTTPLFIAGLLGGAVGAKLPVLILHGRALLATGDPRAVLAGRTIVGGLIGGALAVWWTRRRMGYHTPTGNLFAPGLALGLAIGRLGCLCRGCCYGRPTGGWGIDLGDGVLRYPTQLYEALFGLVLFGWLTWRARRHPPPGQLFREFMLAYFTWRFAIEFLRAEPVWLLALTRAQWICLGVVGYYLVRGRGRRQPNTADTAM